MWGEGFSLLSYTGQAGKDNRCKNQDWITVTVTRIRQRRAKFSRNEVTRSIKNLPKPIPEFSPNAKLETMRRETGKTSGEGVRKAAKRRS